MGARSRTFAAALVLTLLVTVLPARAQFGDDVAAQTLPPELRDVRFDQKLNAQIPLDAAFRNEFGQRVTLSDYFHQGKPVILTLVYYNCPLLCSQLLSNLSSTLRLLNLEMGKQYDVLTVSFDPKETPKLALAKKLDYVQRYGRPGAENYWHFLVGDEKNIHALTEAVGFHYQWDPRQQEYVHPTGIVVLTPEGRISRYFFGIDYSSRDLRLALVQASANRIGSFIDQAMLYCYRYDPGTGKYGLVVMRAVRVAGMATILLLGSFLLVMFRIDSRRQRQFALAYPQTDLRHRQTRDITSQNADPRHPPEPPTGGTDRVQGRSGQV